MQPEAAVRLPDERAYQLWALLVADEELCDAVLERDFLDVARRRGLSGGDLPLLEEFARQPGTRWHVDNLRYRATMTVMRHVAGRLPRTIRLLTGGQRDWYADLASEYLSRNQWADLGHHRCAEALRFARFVRERVLLRRRAPEGLHAALRFEVATCRLQIAAAQDEISGAPRARSMILRGLTPDLVDWLDSGDLGEVRSAGPGPVDALVTLAAGAERASVRRLAPGEADRLSNAALEEAEA